MKRRTLLAGLGAGGLSPGFGFSRARGAPGDQGATLDGRGTAADRERVGDRSTGTLLAGTQYATPVVTVDGPRDGPTVVVVGGLHGDERVGYRTAERVAAGDVAAGRLVVVPRANRPAIEANTREGVGGDLNRQFTPGEAPATELARAVWRVVAEADPDAVVDLHRSTGIYGVHRGSVGQAIFPTVTGEATAYAADAAAYANETEVPWYMPVHEYRRANRLDGSAPLLAHKVAADLGVAGYIVETTNYLVALDTQVDWEFAVAEHLLRAHGLVRPDDGTEADGAGASGEGNGTGGSGGAGE
ncbi:succinylglutamate desuccinylase/aspartoacylase family protein [Halobium salinum]|uniref:Succinylglutamate desuccinylase/aspartoacylase family protein n=1 Tax=Halobium salinum TaxID=1364940 RepID=A0ABD5P6W0_9EURY|nr:succinylglutamate desuccinylase/aspartoacylase family protein [Halobium salinum]